MRLFAAAVPPRALREAVADRVAALRVDLPAARWVSAANLHLTLAFFGEVPEERTGELAAALRPAAAACTAVPAHLAGAGGFPPRGPVRVLWLGVEPAEPLKRLAGRLRSAAAEAGFASDDKPFIGHLTLARCKRPWPAALRVEIERLAPGGDTAFTVRAATLLASELAPGGARYTTLAELPLREAA